MQSLERGTTVSKVVKLRDSHHMLARLMATGLRDWEVAARSGYSIGRIAMLKVDPSFQELVAAKRKQVDEEWVESVDDYFTTVTANRVIAARLLNDKLVEAEPEDMSFRELVMIHADAADRTGYPKRKESINVNLDFASKLDQAIKRSREGKVIDLPSEPVTELPAPGVRRRI